MSYITSCVYLFSHLCSASLNIILVHFKLWLENEIHSCNFTFSFMVTITFHTAYVKLCLMPFICFCHPGTWNSVILVFKYKLSCRSGLSERLSNSQKGSVSMHRKPGVSIWIVKSCLNSFACTCIKKNQKPGKYLDCWICLLFFLFI